MMFKTGFDSHEFQDTDWFYRKLSVLSATKWYFKRILVPKTASFSNFGEGSSLGEGDSARAEQSSGKAEARCDR